MSENKNKSLETEEAEFVIMACNNVIIDAVHAHARLLKGTVDAIVDLVKRTAEGCKTLEEFVHQMELVEDQKAKHIKGRFDVWTQFPKKEEKDDVVDLPS